MPNPLPTPSQTDSSPPPIPTPAPAPASPPTPTSTPTTSTPINILHDHTVLAIIAATDLEDAIRMASVHPQWHALLLFEYHATSLNEIRTRMRPCLDCGKYHIDTAKVIHANVCEDPTPPAPIVSMQIDVTDQIDFMRKRDDESRL